MFSTHNPGKRREERGGKGRGEESVLPALFELIGHLNYLLIYLSNYLFPYNGFY